MNHISTLPGLDLPKHLKLMTEGKTLVFVVDEGRHLTGKMWSQLREIVDSVGNSISLNHSCAGQ